MADYNIIYISPDNEYYLWNGSEFDHLRSVGNEKLMYSGKSYEEKEVSAALKKSRNAVKRMFSDDKHPQIKQVEVPVNSKDEEKGHTPHIAS
jgi:hypothetical protein